MSEDNRTYSNKNYNNRNYNNRTYDNRTYDKRRNTGNKKNTRPVNGSTASGRRKIDAYSVDVAAQRGIVRDDTAQRRNRKPGEVKVASVGAGRTVRERDRDRAENVRQSRAENVQERRSRNVDVASARRQSGKVDVETGRRLDGRVRVPVDRRRVQTASDVRSAAARRAERPVDRLAVSSAERANNMRHQVSAGNGRAAENDRNNNGKKSRVNKNNSGNIKKTNNTKDRRKNDKKDNRPGSRTDNRPGSRNNPPQPKKKKVKRKPTPQELEKKKRLREEKLKRRKQRREKAARVFKVILKILLVLVVISAIAFAIVNTCYRLKKIEVSGTDHYTDQQLEDIVSGGKKFNNTLFFLINNRINPPGDVTFIDKIDVAYVNRNTISITVYEKAMAGCIKYGDKYAYFDGDGIVLEISDEKLDDVPCIEGLTSDSVEQGKKLTVGDDSFFQEILTMTQLIFKNNIQIDKITYDSKQNLILHKDGIKIKIGNADNLENKFMNLESILSTLKGKKGTLDMSNYSASDGNVIFKENK